MTSNLINIFIKMRKYKIGIHRVIIKSLLYEDYLD